MCPHDPGGYFIVKGSEKTIVFQKAHIHNCPLTLHRFSNGVDSFAVCCKSEGEGVADDDQVERSCYGEFS